MVTCCGNCQYWQWNKEAEEWECFRDDCIYEGCPRSFCEHACKLFEPEED